MMPTVTITVPVRGVRVLASSPIGRRLYAMAMDLFWLRNPQIRWHSPSCEPLVSLRPECGRQT